MTTVPQPDPKGALGYSADGDSITSQRARELIRRGGQGVPRYGSPEFEALPSNDPRAVASIVVAAEAWRFESRPDVIAARLQSELVAAYEAEMQLAWERAQAQADEAQWLAFWAREVAKPMRRLGELPNAELRERRGYPPLKHGGPSSVRIVSRSPAA